jgi:hypothetical protein
MSRIVDIDQLGCLAWKDGEHGKTFDDGVLWVLEKIGELPTVQAQKIIRCKECRHRIVNDHYGEKGYLNIKAYCELDTGDPFELGRDAQKDDWFCADAKKWEEQHGSD